MWTGSRGRYGRVEVADDDNLARNVWSHVWSSSGPHSKWDIANRSSVDRGD